MKNAACLFLMTTILSACNSVTDGFESQEISTSASVVTTPTIYDCTSVSGYVNEPTCNVVTGAYCDGAWHTYPDGSLGFCFVPRTGWESCALNPGKWILNVNASAAYAGTGACNVRTTIFGCNSTICKCDDSQTVLDAIADGPATSGVGGIAVGNPVTKDFNVVGSVTEGKTIPTSVSAVCEFAGDEDAKLFGADHTVGDCKNLERIVNQTGDLDTHTGTEHGKPAMVSIDGQQVSVCVVPVPRGTNVEPTAAVPNPSGLWTDPAGAATNWQLDISTIQADTNLGCPSGWTKAATTVGGLSYYGKLKTHSFVYPAASVGSCADRNFVVYQGLSPSSLGITANLSGGYRFPDMAKVTLAPTCSGSVWSENPTATVVINDLTHVVCY